MTVRWDAYETEGHGFSWELWASGSPMGWVASIEPADGGGELGRDRVLAYVRASFPNAEVRFHTYDEWVAEQVEEDGRAMRDETEAENAWRNQ